MLAVNRPSIKIEAYLHREMLVGHVHNLYIRYEVNFRGIVRPYGSIPGNLSARPTARRAVIPNVNPVSTSTFLKLRSGHHIAAPVLFVDQPIRSARAPHSTIGAYLLTLSRHWIFPALLREKTIYTLLI